MNFSNGNLRQEHADLNKYQPNLPFNFKVVDNYHYYYYYSILEIKQ